MTLPTAIVDCHHHFLAPNQPFHAFLGALGAPAYTAEQYAADCGALPIIKTVHIEAIASDSAGEVAYVESLASSGACKVAAIVANCDLSAPDAADQLDRIQAASARVRGIRYILDYDGVFDGVGPTHVACAPPCFCSDLAPRGAPWRPVRLYAGRPAGGKCRWRHTSPRAPTARVTG